MKVKDLQAILAAADPEATVAVAGFETTASTWLAEVDVVVPCTTNACPEVPMTGNLKLKSEGTPTIWIGWSKDYRTDSFQAAVANPDDWADE